MDAADEEAGHTGNLAHIAASRREFFHAVDEGGGDLFIHSLREQQRHVDVDAFADQLAKRGNALGCARYLDHHVFAGHGRSEEHTSELQSHLNLVCRLLLEKKKKISQSITTHYVTTDYDTH